MNTFDEEFKDYLYNTLSEGIVECFAVAINDFPKHKGRPGKIGGSLPKGVVDLSNKFKVKPTIKDVKEFVNKLVKENTKFTTLNHNWFIDTKVNSKAKKHIIYSNKWNKLSREEKDRHNQYVMELEELLKNAQYLYGKENTKKEDKKNIEKYHYFKTNVKIGEWIYEIIFDTEQYNGESDNKPQTVHLYNVHEINRTSSRSEPNK